MNGYEKFYFLNVMWYRVKSHKTFLLILRGVCTQTFQTNLFPLLRLYLRITKLHFIIQVQIQSGKSLSARLSVYLILLYKCNNNT